MEVGTAKTSIAKLSLAEIRSDQFGVTEIRLTEVCSMENCVSEIRFLEIRTMQISVIQNGTAEVRSHSRIVVSPVIPHLKAVPKNPYLRLVGHPNLPKCVNGLACECGRRLPQAYMNQPGVAFGARCDGCAT